MPERRFAVFRFIAVALPLMLVAAGWASAQEFKLYTEKSGEGKNAKGVKITAIPKAGIENELGLKPGDTILRINGRDISNDKELGEALSKIRIHKVTDKRNEPTTNLTLIRSGQNDSKNEVNISGWIIQSSFQDAKTGKTQFYFRSKDPPKLAPNAKKSRS